MPLDPEIQKYMYQQKMSNWINSLAQGLMQTGGQNVGVGLLRAIGGANTGRSDPMDAFKMQMQMEQLAAGREEREKGLEQDFARDALMTSRLPAGPDPRTGINWNQSRALSGPEVNPMAADAFPEAVDAQLVKTLFPDPLRSSDLIEVDTPEGPRLVPASQAVGRTPYDKPESLQLKEIYDPESPTGTRLVRESEAIGRPGKPSSSLMQITGYDEFGRPLIQVGGRGGPAVEKKTKGDLEAKLLDTTDALARLNNIAGSFKPEYQTLSTRGEEWFANLKEKTGLGDISPKERSLVEDYTIYQSTGLDNINRTIRDMTGAQMSIQEAQRLRGAMPDPGAGIWPKQGPTKFLGQVKRVNRDLRAAQARYAYALRTGLPTDPESLSKQIPLDEMEAIIQDRAEQIEAALPANTPPEEAMGIVAARIAREFGLPF